MKSRIKGFLPQRHSLVVQVAEFIEQKLRCGEWISRPPSERRLCDELRVSRKTIRAALERLHRQGWFEISKTRRRKIADRPPRSGSPLRSTKIVLVESVPLLRAQQPIAIVLEYLQAHLQRAGFDMEIFINPRLDLHGSKILEGLVQRTPAACWILASLHPQVQRWFVQRGLPSVVWGSCLPGISLPSVDVDYINSIQHAVDLLVAKGHRRIAYFCGKSEVAGNRLGEETFLSAFPKYGASRAEGRIVYQDSTVDGIVRTLDKLFAGNWVPTALVVADAHHVLTVIGDLARRGLRIPTDLSVITIGDDLSLEFVIPRVARYTYSPAQMARRLAALACLRAKGESLSARACWITTRFLAGDSVTVPARR